MHDTTLSAMIREQRHIFGVCPHCKALFRLVDVGVSYRSRYVPDWLDRIDQKKSRLEEQMQSLEEREKELRRMAIERVTRTELPKRLKRIAPTLVKSGFNPQDVKTVFHPVDFVVFDGMNRDRVRRVVLLDHSGEKGERSYLQMRIKEALESGMFLWKTARIAERGEITVE